MDVYEVTTSQEFVAFCVAGDEAERGTSKRLAERLDCHPTYVSQVTKGKAHFNVDQAVAFCSFFALDTEATEFFLDLLHRDRAATPAARAYFDRRLESRLVERANLKKRFRVEETLSAEQEMAYYDGWIPQTVHMYCQLPGRHTADEVSAALGLDPGKARAVLTGLTRHGFLTETDGVFRSARDRVHLGKDSPVIRRGHAQWRQKTVHQLMERSDDLAVHYSSVVSLSEASVKTVRELIFRHLEETRDEILKSRDESLFVYCLDFYGLVRNKEQP
jgi:hypothetical protein